MQSIRTTFMRAHSRAEMLFNPEHRRALWSMLDQGVVSAGNFFTAWYLARTLNIVEYGVFALLLSIIFFANNAHAALIEFPLSVRVAEYPTQAAKYAAWSLLVTLIISPLTAIAGLIAAVLLGRTDLWIVVSAAAISWQLQETTRTALMAQFRYNHALIGDSINYVGRMAAIAMLVASGQKQLTSVFLAIAITACTATVLQTAQLGIRRWRLAGFGPYLWTTWRFGSWWFYGRMAGVLTLQSFVWVLALRGGAAAGAEYQVLITIPSAVNPILSSMSNIVSCTVSLLYRQAGAQLAIKTALRSVAVVSIPLAMYFSLVYLWPSFLLRTFYGAASPYLRLGHPLQLLAIATAADSVAAASIATLGGMQKTREVFAIQLIGAAVCATIALPLTYRWGLQTAVTSLGFVNAVRAFAAIFLIVRICRAASPQGENETSVVEAMHG